VITILKFIWDSWNISHISKHHIIPEEVEEACHRQPLIQRGTKRNRLVLLGLTEEGRLLNVVLESRGRGSYYPVTSYDASSEDKRLYKRVRGGEDIL